MFGHARENVSEISYEVKTEQWVWATGRGAKCLIFDCLIGVMKND